MRSSLDEQVKTAYLRLASLKQTLELLEASRSTLGQLVDGELARYSTGLGAQTDVLKAQVARTKLVRDIAKSHRKLAELQVELKKLLSRPQDSSDIIPEDLKPTVLRYESHELLALVRKQNPTLLFNGREIEKGEAEIRSAERAGKPDFSVGYMYERTGTNFPAYYMVTVGLTLPRRQRVNARLSESLESRRSAQARLQSGLQEQEAEVQKQVVAATSANEIQEQYRDGLIPQADAGLQATLAAYGSNREEFASVLNALNSVLELKRDYAQEQLEHELALVRLETLTGEALR